MSCFECKSNDCNHKNPINSKKYYINSFKRNVYNWLDNIPLPEGQEFFDIIEVRFKNDRKDFYRNVNKISLSIGDIVAVEAAPGHDIGIVSMIGELVKLEMQIKDVKFESEEIKKVYRKARQVDMEKWQYVRDLEVPTMYKARTIASRLNLSMKLSSVEYQGDGTKAIFYYTAEDRVDFRELIKQLAEEFKVRIEMRQIGVRQESSKLGAIGSCGREVCCSTWLTDFRSVSTNAARSQQLSLNPQKLAGQCAKLKCCLNYEYDCYVDALQGFPDTSINLKTKRGEAFHQKTDVFKKLLWYSYKDSPGVFIELSLERVKEILDLNKKGTSPDELEIPKEPDDKKLKNDGNDKVKFF